MRRVLAFLPAVLLILATAAPTSATHAWNDYHWARSTKSFTLQVGDNLTTSAWSSILGKVATDWSKSKVLDLTVTDGLTNDPQACKPTLGRVEVCNGLYGEQLWVGIAQIWIDGNDHIVQGTVKNNDSFLQNPKWPQYNNEAARRYVLCQELGHTFGLDHQDENFNNESLGTCMDYTRDLANNTTPNKHDYEELEVIYQHLDSYSTVGTATTAISRAPSGLRVITHVIWAR